MARLLFHWMTWHNQLMTLPELSTWLDQCPLWAVPWRDLCSTPPPRDQSSAEKRQRLIGCCQECPLYWCEFGSSSAHLPVEKDNFEGGTQGSNSVPHSKLSFSTFSRKEKGAVVFPELCMFFFFSVCFFTVKHKQIIIIIGSGIKLNKCVSIQVRPLRRWISSEPLALNAYLHINRHTASLVQPLTHSSRGWPSGRPSWACLQLLSRRLPWNLHTFIQTGC